MVSNSYFNHPPFDSFPFKTFTQVVDKMEYLNEESSPYEISPGTDLCISDTNYSLGFLTYLHTFGRVNNKDGEWILNPRGKMPTKKPHRFKLISDAADILEALLNGHKTTAEIIKAAPDLTEKMINAYLYFLQTLSQKGKIEQRSTGWDSTFILTKWE
ncbi:MAG: hypothetical protein ACXADY_21230 [Candidatus Hodarchaeales archaeon]|jgi:hypothetical protein